MEDIRDFLKGTFLEGAPIFPVSSVTGEGLDALRAAIVEESRRQPRRRSDLFRLPRGPRVLAQGARHRGHRHAGFRLRRLRRRSGTSAQRPAVRTSAAFRATGKGQEKAEAGHRISLNLHGLSVEDVSRGDVVTHVGTMKNSRRWIVELTCLKSSPRGLRHRRRDSFPSQRPRACRPPLLLRSRPPGTGRHRAGRSAFFRTRGRHLSATAASCAPFSPLRTVAGGSILYPLDTAPRRSHIDAAMQARLLSLPDADDQTRIGVQLELAGRFGATLADLSILTDLSRKSLEKHCRPCPQGSALCWDKDAKCWISSLWLDKLLERALAATRAFHEKNPLEHGNGQGRHSCGHGRGRSAQARALCT